MKHTCEIIYEIGANNKIYGTDKGICRITGKEGTGLSFNKWVRKTFNDYNYLLPGTIISNQALFCFDESSEIVQRKTGKEKPQRFRTYSHIMKGGKWFCLTKADKRKIFDLIIKGAEMVCLTDTGQKHILFKHRPGSWQLDDLQIKPDIELLKKLHHHMCELIALQFSQKEIITGFYRTDRIIKAGLDNWKMHEEIIKVHRGSGMFDFTSFMIYNKQQETPEPGLKEGKKNK